MFLVSASDGDELKVLANRLGIQSLFTEIKGSPTTKIDNVARLLTEYSLQTGGNGFDRRFYQRF